jgi:hypothetical protein
VIVQSHLLLKNFLLEIIHPNGKTTSFWAVLICHSAVAIQVIALRHGDRTLIVAITWASTLAVRWPRVSARILQRSNIV